MPNPFPTDEHDGRGSQPEAPAHVPRLRRIVFAPAAARLRSAIRAHGIALVVVHESSLPPGFGDRSFNQKLNQTEARIDRQAGLKARLGTPVAPAIRLERTPDSLQRLFAAPSLGADWSPVRDEVSSPHFFRDHFDSAEHRCDIERRVQRPAQDPLAPHRGNEDREREHRTDPGHQTCELGHDDQASNVCARGHTDSSG